MSESDRIDLAVTGLGMVCSLGLDVVTACASARAGIMRLSEIKTLNVALSPGFGRETLDGMPTLSGHAVPEIGYGFSGAAKVLALATVALKDLLSRSPLSPEEMDRTGICLNLSDRYLEEVAAERDDLYDELNEERPLAAWRRTTQSILGKLVARCGLTIPATQQHIAWGGHAGWVDLLRFVAGELKRGQWDRCVLGGVDSCLEAEFLLVADQLGLLKTDEQPAGFLPGEAAAFCMLERASVVPPERYASVIAQIESAGQAVESADLFSENPMLGRGLEQAVVQAITSGDSTSNGVDWVVVDLNGLERRALDWGHAAVRLRHHLRQGNTPIWLPVVSFGELGAATGPVSLCLIGRAFARGYAPGPQALIALASNNQQRGAVAVRHPQK